MLIAKEAESNCAQGDMSKRVNAKRCQVLAINISD